VSAFEVQAEDAPRFLTMLASKDGIVRLYGEINNHNTDKQTLQVLATIYADQTATFATRANSWDTWSIPVEAEQR